VPAPRVRVHEVSKMLGVSNAELIQVLKSQFDVDVKSHSSTLDQETADKVISSFKQGKQNSSSASAEACVVNKASISPQLEVSKSAPSMVSLPKPSASVQSAPMPPPQKKPEQQLSAGIKKVNPVQPRVVAPPVKRTALSSTLLNRPPSSTAPVSTPPPQPVKKTALNAFRPQQQDAPRPEFRPEFRKPPSPQYPARPAVNPMASLPDRPREETKRSTPFRRDDKPAQPGFDKKPLQTSYKPPQTFGGRPSGRSSSSSRANKQASRKEKEELEAVKEELPKIISLSDPIAVRDLAEKLRLKDTEVIKHLFMKGMMVTVNQILDVDFAKTIAKEFEFEVTEVTVTQFEGEYSHLADSTDKKLSTEKYKNLVARSPVVSIMGHVDHGKTTLLDSIRETRNKVVDSESGGITQSIGAYCVEKNDNRIVFLDTPGHEAFTAMRMRGAQSTDIAVLVVAADDGIMPQTIEAINHAKVAKIPIIVAVNKIDKDNADPDKVLTQLSEYGLSPEKWGGDTLTVEISALQKVGIDDLLDSILLVSELLDLKADPTVAAEGIVIEAQLDKRTGPVATVLVQNGTLRVGDNILIGSVSGRVRALVDDLGKRVKVAAPATPVEVLGLNSVPNAGDLFEIIENDKQFKQKLTHYKLQEREERIGVTRSVTAGFSGKSEIESDNAVQESQFNLLVKADAQGSLEAVVDLLQQMTNDEVKINIIHSATGDISEADVMLASTAKALIIGFNSKPDNNAQRLTEHENVSIRQYDVIYHISEDIQKWVLGQLSPDTEEVYSGTAEVRQIFKVGKANVIAGCMVTKGKMVRNAKAVVMRQEKEIFNGILVNLKRFKDDVKEVASGYECGISFDRFQDLQEGDAIEVYVTKSLERTSF
jgi:translation initiation factor IF-2